MSLWGAFVLRMVALVVVIVSAAHLTEALGWGKGENLALLGLAFGGGAYWFAVPKERGR